MKEVRVGLWIAVAALLVNSPRLVILFLDADGISLGLPIEGLLLGAGGVATGIVLSGGGAYIAHTIAKPMRRNFAATVALIATWVSLLVFSVILLAPSLVSALRNNDDMKQVLATEQSQWLWAIVAVVAVEVLAAGAMVAQAIREEPAVSQKTKPGKWNRLFDAATDVAVAKLDQLSKGTQQVVAQPKMETVTEVSIAKPSTIRQDALLEDLRLIENPDDINKTDLGVKYGVSRTQIGKDLKRLVAENRLELNGTVKVIG